MMSSHRGALYDEKDERRELAGADVKHGHQPALPMRQNTRCVNAYCWSVLKSRSADRPPRDRNATGCEPNMSCDGDGLHSLRAISPA